MSTHNICFRGDISKILIPFWLKKVPYQELCISYNKVAYTNSADPNWTALSGAV